MPTPANRVPVRVGRGTKVNLDTALAAGDLKEGEIVYAVDEDSLYVVEGGALVQAGSGGGTATSLERGDGGDFETASVESSFVTNILGGGDFEVTSIDPPVENLGGRDGGLFV